MIRKYLEPKRNLEVSPSSADTSTIDESSIGSPRFIDQEEQGVLPEPVKVQCCSWPLGAEADALDLEDPSSAILVLRVFPGRNDASFEQGIVASMRNPACGSKVVVDLSKLIHGFHPSKVVVLGAPVGDSLAL